MDTREPTGSFYAIVGNEGSLIISRYDDAEGMTPTEFVAAYRRHHELHASRITRFQEPIGNGCRLFVTDDAETRELFTAAVFIPDGLGEVDVRRELADGFQMRVFNFDAVGRSAA